MIMPHDDYDFADSSAMSQEDRELVHDLGLHILDYAKSKELSVLRVISAMEICKKLFIDLLYQQS